METKTEFGLSLSQGLLEIEFGLSNQLMNIAERHRYGAILLLLQLKIYLKYGVFQSTLSIDVRRLYVIIYVLYRQYIHCM